MITILVAILAFAIFLSIVSWLNFRPKKWLFPSDMFFVICFLTVGSVPFLNLYSQTDFSVRRGFTDETVKTALICLIIMYATFAFAWPFRKNIQMQDLVHVKSPKNSQNFRIVKKNSRIFLKFCMAAIFLISGALLVYPPYLQFKTQVWAFLIGNINADDYQVARRITYAEDNFIISVVGRLRYTVFPVLFVGAILHARTGRGLLSTSALAIVAFAVGPASFAKAVLVIFLAYFVIAITLQSGIRKPFTTIVAVPMIVVSLLFVQIILTLVYFLQYTDSLFGLEGFIQASDIAYFRIFGANYNGLLLYLEAFPSGGVGFGALSFSSLWGAPQRSLDQEVAIYHLGASQGMLTSFPTVFIANAYASFGYIGVFVYSAVVAFILYWVDLTFSALKTNVVRTIYYAIMLINVYFFAQLSAPTTLITYGVIVIPIALKFVDKIISRQGLL